MNDNPANDYYPKDLYQIEKKEATMPPKPFDFQSLFSTLHLNNPLLTILLQGQSLDQKSIIQALSSTFKQNDNKNVQQKTLDEDFCEEL